MHETALMRDLMASIQRLMVENQVLNVKMVKIRLGALTAFSEEHFREHFSEAVAGSLIENARLVVETSNDIGAADAQAVILEEIEGECARGN